MEKIVYIAGKEVKMRVSARLPYEYRNLFGKDIITGMQKMEREGKTGELSTDSMQMFENLAWLMAKSAGEDVHADLPAKEAVAEWLDGFEGMFAIFEAIPDIMELWISNTSATSVPRKK